MKTLKLDSKNNLVFGSNFILLNGKEAIIQDCKTRLSMFKGEYPFNKDEGIDYINLLLDNNIDNIKQTISNELMKDERIQYVTIIDLNKDSKGKLTINVQCTLTSGEIINV